MKQVDYLIDYWINLIFVNETSYLIDNLDTDCEILIFNELKSKISNLPINIKEIWLSKYIKTHDIKLPLNCEIKRF